MKIKIIKFMLYKKITILQKLMKKQEKAIKSQLNKLDEMEPKWEKIKLNYK